MFLQCVPCVSTGQLQIQIVQMSMSSCSVSENVINQAHKTDSYGTLEHLQN